MPLLKNSKCKCATTCLSPCRMLPASGVPVLLLATLSAYAAAQSCQCSAPPSAGLKVNCSAANRTELPSLPANTTELFVQDSRLTCVSPGSFDRLVGLRKVALHGNPFHCDCRIQYLRNWLLKTEAVVTRQPVCASPSSVANKSIRELCDAHFAPCAPRSCTHVALNVVVAASLFCVCVLLAWSLKVIKQSEVTLIIEERHWGLEVKAQSSFEVKQGRRRQPALDCELERPLLNMDLLPQVLDVLHREHNITISPTGPTAQGEPTHCGRRVNQTIMRRAVSNRSLILSEGTIKDTQGHRAESQRRWTR